MFMVSVAESFMKQQRVELILPVAGSSVAKAWASKAVSFEQADGMCALCLKLHAVDGHPGRAPGPFGVIFLQGSSTSQDTLKALVPPPVPSTFSLSPFLMSIVK